MYEVLTTAASFPPITDLLSKSGSGLDNQSYAFLTAGATELLYSGVTNKSKCARLANFLSWVTDEGISYDKKICTFFFLEVLVEEWELRKIWSMDLNAKVFEFFRMSQGLNQTAIVGILSDRTDEDKDFELVTGGAAHVK